MHFTMQKEVLIASAGWDSRKLQLRLLLHFLSRPAVGVKVGSFISLARNKSDVCGHYSRSVLVIDTVYQNGVEMNFAS